MQTNILEQYKDLIEQTLGAYMQNDAPALLKESMAYSVAAGGKRLRPILTLLAADLADVALEQALSIACGIEMIHTYSLIHDDLPALDNDTLRRGKPTNHVVYGEAQAILAGDGLLTFAFEIMLQNALAYKENAFNQLWAISTVAKAAGVTGMVGGQVVDVALEGTKASVQQLEYIHAHKTADLFIGALLGGLLLGGPTDGQRDALYRFGYHFGIMFQAIDDVLDTVENPALGKTIGKDAASGKNTMVLLYGVDGAKQKAQEHCDKAVAALRVFGEKAQTLTDLCKDTLSRTF